MPTTVPCQMYFENHVLYVKLTGVWTKQISANVLKDVQKLIEAEQQQPWAALVDMREWIMPTMDAMTGFEKIYQWCIEHNQTHEATVCRPSLQQQIVQNVSEYDQQAQCYVDNVDAAVTWLKSKGFAAHAPVFRHPADVHSL